MKKRITNSFKFLSILYTILLLTSCAVEEMGTKQNPNVSLDNAKNWFEQYKSSTVFNSAFNNVVYDWENSKTETLENDLQAVVVPVYDINEGQNYKGKKFLYFYPAENETNFETTLYELKPLGESLQVQHSTTALSNFDGYIVVWDLEKGFVESTKFENSIAKATFSGEEIPRTVSADTFGKMTIDPPAASYCLGDLILCNDYKDEGGGYYGTGYVYYVNNYGSSGSYAGSYFNSSHGSGGSGGGGGASLPVIKITDNLTGKAKCLNALLNKSGNSFVQKLLANFAGKSEFNIEIVSSENVYSDLGKTKEVNGTTEYDNVNGSMKIQISSSRTDAHAALEGARTILHEYIHADMYRKQYTINTKDVDVKDFNIVFDLYAKNQHSIMAILYLNSMKEALKEFHKTALKDDYNKYITYYGEVPSDAFYEAMAWGGLRNSNVKAWTDLPADKKASIESLANRVNLLGKTVSCPN